MAVGQIQLVAVEQLGLRQAPPMHSKPEVQPLVAEQVLLQDAGVGLGVAVGTAPIVKVTLQAVLPTQSAAWGTLTGAVGTAASRACWEM